ncbi:SDR family NAD(P)-dependent oxidoreductase [Streptomyces sp. SID14478]|uniref:SDR family NAD(P)-dependent oxidoreductase n=1 Tax=Streptomyces sp. SID14478 TaxID=2706073 RepID=UPI0013DCABC0|nr:SDR family NAD(P)-dependent oxidoreductase [Streptomyces sp. SID14478]
MPHAVITGATAGIGLAFARQLASCDYDLTLVARTERDLDRVAAELRHATCHITALPADLASATGCTLVAQHLQNQTPDLLINNAGIVLARPFLDNAVTAEEQLLDVNVRAVLRLTHAVLPAMLRRGTGQIINVSSFCSAGLSAMSNTYPASKAWLNSFTASLAHSHQVRSSDVQIMALLPGFTRTELFTRNQLEASHLPAWMWLDSERVVSVALRDLRRGKKLSIPGKRYKAATWALRHLPPALLQQAGWDWTHPRHVWRPSSSPATSDIPHAIIDKRCRTKAPSSTNSSKSLP